MIKVGIVGVSGYTGRTALELLWNHPGVRVTYLSANDVNGKLSDIWPQFKGHFDFTCKNYDTTKAIKACDLVFLAVPHTVAMKLAPALLKAKKRVIDFSSDYRLVSGATYKKWYGVAHSDLPNMKKAVYGLPELYKANIQKAQLIANPGCYPTAALLSLAPIVSLDGKSITSIIIDAKSGITGAGRKANVALSFPEVNENFKAYKILKHQHSPEIDLYLSKISRKDFGVHFVPHLLPVNRGILETIYVHLSKKVDLKNLHQLYQRFYKTEPFVRLKNLNQQPELKNVVKTNYCDIGLTLSPNGRLLVITSAIDNLVKGAAGQAVQNMNIMCDFPETEGLL